MRSRVVFVAFAGIAAAACGLSVVGEMELGGGPDGGPSPVADGSPVVDGGPPVSDDGATDAGIDAFDTFDATPACDAGAGVTSVVVIPVDGGTCPSGTVEKVVQTAPVATAGACTCGDCVVSAEASCAGGGMQLRYGSTNTCGGGPNTYNIVNNQCTDFNEGTFDVNNFHSWSARTPTAGACTAPSVMDATKVTTTPLRTCVAATPDVACQALADSRLCIESSVACAAPFSEAVAVGDGANVACATCGCTRTGTTCKIDYFGTNDCSDAVKMTINATGVCTGTNNAQNVNHFKMYASGLTCNRTPGAATPSLSNPKTLCCKP